MSTQPQIVSVRDHGARGDGQSDDTQAIHRAAAALPERDGVLFFPPGHYLTAPIATRPFTTYMGHSSWAYSYRQPGATVLSPVHPEQPCLFLARATQGTRFTGLTLRGNVPGENPDWPAVRGATHGIHIEQSDMAVIDNCRVERFSGHGILCANGCGVWTIRHSLVLFNRGNGIDADACADGWIVDTQVTANREAGVRVMASVTITGNRIEHNHRAGLILNPGYVSSIQITGNLFCTNGGPGLEHDGNLAEGITVTGNTFRRLADAEQPDDPRLHCQVRLIGFQGLAFVGNAIYCDRQTRSVATGMILGRLTDSVVANNTLFHAATQELIRDEGGHQNTTIRDNPGRLLATDNAG